MSECISCDGLLTLRSEEPVYPCGGPGPAVEVVASGDAINNATCLFWGAPFLHAGAGAGSKGCVRDLECKAAAREENQVAAKVCITRVF